jgi:hypothetical protein
MKILKKVKQWVPARIAAEVSEPISAISYADGYDPYQHEDIMHCIAYDERCETMVRGLTKKVITSHDNVFLTPHFLRHFEFTERHNICDYGILRCRFKYAANQLGFDILRQNLKQAPW